MQILQKALRVSPHYRPMLLEPKPGGNPAKVANQQKWSDVANSFATTIYPASSILNHESLNLTQSFPIRQGKPSVEGFDCPYYNAAP